MVDDQVLSVILPLSLGLHLPQQGGYEGLASYTILLSFGQRATLLACIVGILLLFLYTWLPWRMPLVVVPT